MTTAVVFFLMTIVYVIVFSTTARRYRKELEIKDEMIGDIRSLCDVRDRNLVNSSDRYQKEVKSLKEDIRMLVSTDEKDAAKSKQVYDKWRAEFGMDEKREQDGAKVQA